MLTITKITSNPNKFGVVQTSVVVRGLVATAKGAQIKSTGLDPIDGAMSNEDAQRFIGTRLNGAHLYTYEFTEDELAAQVESGDDRYFNDKRVRRELRMDYSDAGAFLRGYEPVLLAVETVESAVEEDAS